jgi:hypothetical protein
MAGPAHPLRGHSPQSDLAQAHRPEDCADNQAALGNVDRGRGVFMLEPGRCSACRQPAERGPSGYWWHIDIECPNRSMTIYQPINYTRVEGRKGWALSPAPASQLPAEFVSEKA